MSSGNAAEAERVIRRQIEQGLEGLDAEQARGGL